MMVGGEARAAVRDWARRAGELLGVSHEEWPGCSEETIQAVARAQGRTELPAALDEFLRLTGGRGAAGAVLNPEMIDCETLLQIVQQAERAWRAAGLAEPPWEPGQLVVGHSTNGTVLWFGGPGDDPPVHAVNDAGETGPPWPSFTSYLAWALDNWLEGERARVARQG